MKIAGAAVKHSITTIMVFIALFILGAISLSRLGLELFPDISFPTVVVVTIYPGVGPYEVESNVTKPLEDALYTMNGVKEVSSTSSEGVSMVVLNFEWDTDLDKVVADVRENLNSVEGDLPESVNRPMIFKYSPQQLPSMIINISSKTSGIDTRKLAQARVVPELEKIEGVGRVTLSGGREQAVICSLDLDSLSKLEIPI